MAPWRASRTFRRYVALEAPGWAVAAAVLGWCVHSFGLDAPVAALLFALWVGKDFVLYPLLRDAYEETDPDVSAQLVGRVGEARGRLDPGGQRTGYVRLGSELWRARLAVDSEPVEAGAPIRVRSVRGLTLVVEATSSRDSPSAAP